MITIIHRWFDKGLAVLILMITTFWMKAFSQTVETLDFNPFLIELLDIKSINAHEKDGLIQIKYENTAKGSLRKFMFQRGFMDYGLS